MGCGHGRTVEKKGKGGKFKFPECSFSINCNCEISCMELVDKSKILLGTENEIKLLNLSSNEPKTIFNEHKGNIKTKKRIIRISRPR